MVVAALLSLAILQTPTVGRYELGERLKTLDRLWLVTKEEEVRRKAVTHVSSAVNSFFMMRTSDACRALDEAVAALEGRQPTPADAVVLRPSKRVFAPGEEVAIKVFFAYETTGTSPTVRLKGNECVPEQGQMTILTISPESLPREDADIALEANLGGKTRLVRFSIVRDLDARLARIKASPSRMARDLAEGIESALPEQGETILPIAKMLKSAEALDSQRTAVSEVEEVFYARQGSTILRAFVPKSANKSATVVIALHGAGGSENLFFEGYGAGLAVSEARRRGWVLLSPRATPNAAKDVLKWLEEVREIKPTRLFVMGHSMGGALALGTGELKPAAIALFAPAARTIPENLVQTPIFLAVGKQEMMMLRTGALALAELVKKRGVFKEYDPCEHLMIVAEALPDAFRFFAEQQSGIEGSGRDPKTGDQRP